MAALSAPLEVRGCIRVPGDKSISHRALIISAIAGGKSEIRGLLESADIRSTTNALRALGVRIESEKDAVVVHGGTLVNSGETLNCGNSGTTARLLAGLVAGAGLDATFTGDESLNRRPMQRVATPLESMGARVELSSQGGLPMRVRGGALRDIEWTSDIASAQVKSAVLLAGCVAGVRVSYSEPVLSRDHTERMLEARGAALVRSGTALVMNRGSKRLAPKDVSVPGDPSSAAFLAGLAAIARRSELTIERVCLNATRTGLFAVLQRMGAELAFDKVREEDGERVGDVRVRTSRLHGTTIGGDEVPSLIDEIPLLACLAAVADGETVISGAGELRVKESDRIAAVVAGLRGLGGDAEELADGMRVRGPAAALRGRVVTHGDHRIAMAFGVLSALPRCDIVMDDPACVEVSYPNYWRDLAHVRK